MLKDVAVAAAGLASNHSRKPPLHLSIALNSNNRVVWIPRLIVKVPHKRGVHSFLVSTLASLPITLLHSSRLNIIMCSLDLDTCIAISRTLNF
ncbi:hypothetical protein VKT23_017916 [Stygiomarasmius scandens]|uniref:Uncharacterized protein n=1 Tax=Marasmiellus scandens TaxID=2682957 RepID=A0ABR1ITY1_9AGAR